MSQDNECQEEKRDPGLEFRAKIPFLLQQIEEDNVKVIVDDWLEIQSKLNTLKQD